MLLIVLSTMAFAGDAALFSKPSETLAGDGNVYFGRAVAGAGDTNGDGYADFIVGAPWGKGDVGSVHVFFGSPDGVAPRSVVLTGSSCFGATLSTDWGDVNGDGYDDVLVGAYCSDDANTAHLFYGGPDGPDPKSSQEWVGDDDMLGWALSIVGDTNGDGYEDIVIGAPGAGDTYEWGQTGEAYYHLGGPSGLGAEPDLVLAEVDWVEGAFGLAVSGGDVNADGLADVLVGSWGYSAHLFEGNGSGLTAPATAMVTGDYSYYGFSAAIVGDVNGDGYADSLVTALMGMCDGPGWEVTGSADLYPGGPTGMSTVSAYTYCGVGDQRGYGEPMHAAGDVNADGYDDVFIGERWATDMFLYAGGPTGLTEPATWVREWSDAAGVGDINGDGIDDFVATTSSSTVEVYFGACTTLAKRYADADRDGYGTGKAEEVCPGIHGYSDAATDCDDASAQSYPGAPDECGDGVDSDCDGFGLLTDDEDGDGTSTEAELAAGTDPCSADSGAPIDSGASDTGASADDTHDADAKRGCSCAQGAPRVQTLAFGVFLVTAFVFARRPE